MSKVGASFRIWAITILINAMLFGFIHLLSGNFWVAAQGVTIFFMSFIIGLPFWLITLILVEVTTRMPYSAIGRMCWIAGTMAALIALFYACVSWLVTGRFSLVHRDIALLTGTTIAALLVALFLNRSTFTKAVSNTSIADNV